MRKHQELAFSKLSPTYRRYLDDWQVSSKGLALPAEGDFPAVHVWHGRFVLGETVVLSARTDTEVSLRMGTIFAGIASETDYGLAENDADKLAVFGDAAINAFTGLVRAIAYLEQIATIPLFCE